MFQTEFASDYTSLDSTGADYITKHTNIKLVGIDYLRWEWQHTYVGV